MLHDYSRRADGPERMDVEVLSPSDARRIVLALERINRWLGGVTATLGRLRQFSAHWTPAQPLRIIDWGTGGADLDRDVIRRSACLLAEIEANRLQRRRRVAF